jgi:hypothetical protein
MAGHEGDHGIVINWTDEECFDPEVDATTVWRDKPQSGGAIVTMNAGQILAADFGDDEDDAPMGTGRCFSCNCPEAAHIPGEGCAAHTCRSFVP